MKDKPIQDPIAVSIDAAVAMSGVGRTTIYAALSKGAIRSLKVGKRRLIPVEALRAWLDTHEVD